jgi:hypothetical protein
VETTDGGMPPTTQDVTAEAPAAEDAAGADETSTEGEG